MRARDKGPRIVRGDLAGLEALGSESLAVFCFADVRPLAGVAGFLDWRLCGALSHSIERGLFSAGAEEVLLLPAFGRLRARRVFAFGLGPLARASVQSFRQAAEHAATVMSKAGAREIVLAAAAARRRPEIETMFVDAASELPRDRVAVVLALTERNKP